MISDEPEADEIASNFTNERRRTSSSLDAGLHQHQITTRNFVAFWLLGLCNNFGYVVMLSAAKDILERSKPTSNETGCIEDITDVKCSTISTGAVLLADILPSLAIKLVAPFALQSIPYLTRHAFVVIFQFSSYLIVAFSTSLSVGLLGVVFASLGAGLGEVTYLSLSSHFHNDAISSWSSGTGGAGILGSLAFAALTESKLLALNPQQALLLMLFVPLTLLFTFWQLLHNPPSVHRVSLLNPTSWTRQQPRARHNSSPTLDSESPSSSTLQTSDDDLLQSLLHGNRRDENHRSVRKMMRTNMRKIKPLLKFMIPLTLVYFAEYFINQGLLELLVFNCAHSFDLSPAQQYRWYQVLYQLGVFVSRSSLKFFPIRPAFIPIMALLQSANALFLFEESFNLHLPHILLLMLIVLYEGLLGGSAYVNTFSAIHRKIRRSNREFSISFVAMSDSFGIVLAGFVAIYAHNFICQHRR